MTWRIIALDERTYWSQDILSLVDHARGLYLYDDELHVYCCSMMPTYELHRVGTELWPRAGISDAQRELLADAEIASDAASEHTCYVGIYDRMMKSPAVEAYIDPDDDDPPWEQVYAAISAGACRTPDVRQEEGVAR